MPRARASRTMYVDAITAAIARSSSIWSPQGSRGVYRESPLDSPDLAAVRRALDHLLAAHPFAMVHLRHAGVDVRLFTTLTTLGTPLDVTAQELRIESYFPADDATERFLRGLAGA